MITSNSKSSSIFTLDEKIQVNDGQRWSLSVSLPALERKSAKPWIAFLASLNGIEGTFLFRDCSESQPLGTGNGSPMVNGADQVGKTINLSGLFPSESGVLKAGDYFSINNNLYVALNDLDSDSNGEGSLDLWPNIKTSYADGTLLDFVDAQGTFRLTKSAVPLFQKSLGDIYNINFTAVSV